MNPDELKALCNTITTLASTKSKENLALIKQKLDMIEDYFLNIKNKVDNERIKPLPKKLREKFMQEVNLSKDEIKEYLKKKKKAKLKTETSVAYTLYKSNFFGKISNRFCGKVADFVIRKAGESLKPLYNGLKKSGIKVLSKTYISMMIFSSMLAMVVVSLLTILFFKHQNQLIQVMRGVLFGMLAAIITGVIFYSYPSSVAKSKESAIRRDLPFVIMHMAAVSGSGSKPISIFKTVLSSDEYPGVRDEIKKVVNYVNLFGYDLSTSLRLVASRTPSIRFKDLLDGIVNTIESGGDLKDYLEAKASEALNTYRLERKKAVESISTYSDIYTTVLIAAPLLFFVTLAIIQTMGGQFGGVQVSTLATIGTYLVLPVLNIAYLIFISVVQPK